MDSRARRIGENEVLFRHVNEQIRSLDQRLPSTASTTYGFLCECGDSDCTERIELTIDEYEQIHVDPRQFVIVTGHEEPSVETVVEHHEGYSVVRKDRGDAAEIAKRGAAS
jgi:hypothetical protein